MLAHESGNAVRHFHISRTPYCILIPLSLNNIAPMGRTDCIHRIHSGIGIRKRKTNHAATM